MVKSWGNTDKILQLVFVGDEVTQVTEATLAFRPIKFTKQYLYHTWRHVTFAQKNGANFPPHRPPPHSSQS